MYPPIYTAITTPWPYTLLEVMPSAGSIKIETEKEDSFFFFPVLSYITVSKQTKMIVFYKLSLVL